MNGRMCRTALAWALGAIMASNVAAQASLPAVQKSGTVEYLSGGIGSDEAQAIEAAGQQWPLTLEFTVTGQQRATFAADVLVVVRDAQKRIALQATAGGPFMLVRLPPGQYEVEARYASQTQRRQLTVVQGKPSKSIFMWPTGS